MLERTSIIGITRKIKAIQAMRLHYVVNDRGIETAVPSVKLYLVPLSWGLIGVKYAWSRHDVRRSKADARRAKVETACVDSP